MKYCISIFCLPQEIDDLELTLSQLKKAFRYVDEKNFILDITLALTGELTLWQQSKIPPEYFLHDAVAGQKKVAQAYSINNGLEGTNNWKTIGFLYNSYYNFDRNNCYLAINNNIHNAFNSINFIN